MTEVDTDRRVLHCDMDCFYAAVHMRDDPGLAGKPVVIGGSPEGRGVVAAASYEARRFGIHSALPAARAVRLCPQAIFIKPDFNRYREESQRIVEIFHEFTPVIQQVSIDEAYLDVTEHLEPWGSGTAVAQEIKRRVRHDRGLTVSVGVGPNRLVAKIASDFEKPDGLTVVKPAMVQRLKKHGIEKIAELRALPQDRLEALFGKHGRWLYKCARGIDERPVRTHRERKSLSSERTYAKDLTQLEEMDAELDRLAERVSRGLKKRELSAQTVTVKVPYGDFTTLTRSHTIPSPTSDEGVLAGWAHRLLRRTEAGRRSVRLLGLGAGNLVHGEVSQLELF